MNTVKVHLDLIFSSVVSVYIYVERSWKLSLTLILKLKLKNNWIDREKSFNARFKVNRSTRVVEFVILSRKDTFIIQSIPKLNTSKITFGLWGFRAKEETKL